MGLDIVELIMDVEDAFGFKIPDEEATRILTVQDLVNYISEHVSTVSQETCQTQRIYYRLRRGFCCQVPALAGDLRPQTKIKDILHKNEWPEIWAAIRKQVGEDYWPEKIPWPGILQQGPSTLRELTYYVAFNLPKPNTSLKQSWTKERIALEVRDIVKDYAGKAGFKQSDRLYRDLGIG